MKIRCINDFFPAFIHQISFKTAWQFGQFRLRQELLWNSVWPHSVHWQALAPRAPDLQRMTAWETFFWMSETGCPEERKESKEHCQIFWILRSLIKPTCHSVKRIGRSHQGIRCQMYVYNRGRNRPVSHERFQSEQVGSVFIMVGGESMAECVTGKTVLPSEFFFVCKDKAGDTLVIDGSVRFFLLWKEPVFRPGTSRK